MIRIAYRQNLKMSPGKLAAQCVHAVLGLPEADPGESIVVLGYRDAAYRRVVSAIPGPKSTVRDAGYTEVPAGTETCTAWRVSNYE